MSFRRRTNEALAQLQQQVAELGTTAQSTVPPLPPPSDAPFDAPTPGTSLADLSEMVHALATRVDGLDERQRGDHERVSLRLEELTAQFSNQLTELGNELEAGHKEMASQLAAQEQRLEELVQRSVSGDGSGQDALVEELRSNQIRIANDLARHEIAFRQDLAALAELVNKSRRTPG
jgi:DNA repair exonuclease SbcCD ATPase subunit